MKFIHLADVHLDSPFKGLSFLPSKERNLIMHAAAKSLKAAVDLALAEQVDLVLIAGDTFDNIHPSPQSQVIFKQEMDRLVAQKIQVVMVMGNHDYLPVQNLLLPDSEFFTVLGQNQQVESKTLMTKAGFTYVINGVSYAQNHITTDLLPEFPARSSNYTIGLLHAGMDANQHGNYAPFTLTEMQALNYDYFALGHIHARNTLSVKPLIQYAGNLQGRDIGELGEKGVYLLNVDEQSFQTSAKFVKTAPITWQQVDMPLTEQLSNQELTKLAVQVLQGQTIGKTYFSLKITNAQYLTQLQQDYVADSSFWESLSANLPEDSQVVDMRFKFNEQLAVEKQDQAAFMQANQEIFANDLASRMASWINKSKYFQDLYQDPTFIEQLKEMTQAKIANKIKGVQDETEAD